MSFLSILVQFTFLLQIAWTCQTMTLSGHHNMLVYCPQYTIHVHDPRFSLLPVQHQDSVFPRGYPCEPLPLVRTW